VAEKITSLESCISRIQQARESKEVVSIAFLGNIVTLWEALADHYDRTGELLVELGSDQTSLHNPYNGGYYPVQLSYQEANQMMVNEPERFKYFQFNFHSFLLNDYSDY
jgi:urocanate hydratase